MEQRLKKLLLFIIASVLLIPLIQFRFHCITERKLGGYSMHQGELQPQLSDTSWLDGSFQTDFEVWYKYNFGFRNTFVRFNNQINYTVFDTCIASDMVVGKNGFLFYRNYLTAYCGQDYSGDEYISLNAAKIKELQDTLHKHDITLIVALAPGPASFFPEFVPDDYSLKSGVTTYSRLTSILKNSGVDFIDFNKWFSIMKGSSSYPLYTLSGTHWSCFGAALAADSLVKYVEAKRAIQLPTLEKSGLEISQSLRLPDNDIYAVANLWQDYIPQTVAYPKWQYVASGSEPPLNLLAVGDSYFDVILYNTDLRYKCFKSIDFWSYNSVVFNANGDLVNQACDLSAGDEIQKHQVVLLIATEANYGAMYWDFVNEAHQYFCLGNKSMPDPQLKSKRVGIIRDQKWFTLLRINAQNENISVDSTLNRTARALLNQ
ncbi:MAG: hypothetical protein RL007_1112 [Bacteroidota bacterium]|jgi:hypothetical protein